MYAVSETPSQTVSCFRPFVESGCVALDCGAVYLACVLNLDAGERTKQFCAE